MSKETKDDRHFRFTDALRNGNIKQLKTILGSIKCSTNRFKVLSTMSSSGQYPLHYTQQEMSFAETSNTESRSDIVQLILDSISRVKKLDYLELRDAAGYTALHTAAIHGEKDVLSTILESVPRTDGLHLLKLEDRKQRNVLQCAQNEEIKELIQAYTCLVTVATEYNEEFTMVDLPENLMAWPVSLQASIDLAKLDLASPADGAPETKDCHVQYLTVENALEQFDNLLDMVRMDENYNFLIHKLLNECGMTILHVLVRHNKTDWVRKLLAALKPSEHHWELISKPCHCGKTALHYASMEDNLEMVHILLHYAAKQDADLVAMKDSKNCEAINYTRSQELKRFLPMVETHYWKTLYRPPTTLIFYNKFVKFPRAIRNGAEDERDMMAAAFEACEIKPEIHPEFTEDSLRMIIAEAVQRNANDISALIVIIMTHGEDGLIYDKDYCEIPLQDVLNIISRNAFLDLTPKVLMLQSCQHDGDDGEAATTPGEEVDAATAKPLLTKKTSMNANRSYRIPTSNFCLITPTLAGTKATRGLVARALFITTKQDSGPTDLRDVFNAMARRMGEKQHPQANNTLKKILRLKNPILSSPFTKLKQLFTQRH